MPTRLLSALLSTLLLALSSTASLAGPLTPWTGVWEGRIGQQKVVVALSEDAPTEGAPAAGSTTLPSVSGRYFYERYGRDLSLFMVKSDTPDALQLIECPPDYVRTDQPCSEPTGTWTLQLRADKAAAKPRAPRLSGQWTPAGLPGRRSPTPSPIMLQRVAAYTASAGALRDPYEQRRDRGTQRTLRAGGSLGPVTWMTMVDPRSGVSAPQFNRGSDMAALMRINEQIESRWRERVKDALAAVDHDDELRVVFANTRWVALTYSAGFYHAGAAHPSNAFDAMTYDLRTGQKVDWRQWFRFTGPGLDTLDLSRQDTLAAQALRAHVARTGQAGSAPTEAESCAQMVLDHYGCRGGRCAHSDLTQGQVPSGWVLWPTPEGLSVAIDIYPEVARGCRGESVTLPWAQVRTALRRPQTLP